MGGQTDAGEVLGVCLVVEQDLAVREPDVHPHDRLHRDLHLGEGPRLAVQLGVPRRRVRVHGVRGEDEQRAAVGAAQQQPPLQGDAGHVIQGVQPWGEQKCKYFFLFRIKLYNTYRTDGPVQTYYGFVKRSQYGYTWVNFLEAESAHDLLEVASGSVGGDHGVQVQAALLEEHLVAEVVHGSDHPVPGPVPLPPAVRHVHVGVRPVVGVGQSPAGQGGAEHHVSVNKSLKHEGSFANITQSRKHRRLIVCSSSHLVALDAAAPHAQGHVHEVLRPPQLVKGGGEVGLELGPFEDIVLLGVLHSCTILLQIH